MQLLSITVRADIPLGLDLLMVAWRTLVGMTPDTSTDLQEADYMTYAYLKKIEMVGSVLLCSSVLLLGVKKQINYLWI